MLDSTVFPVFLFFLFLMARFMIINWSRTDFFDTSNFSFYDGDLYEFDDDSVKNSSEVSK